MDIWSVEKRSEVMSKIRGKNTKPERLVRSVLHTNGFRFRVNKQDLPGNPDIVLKKYKSVIFVHGCFWHFHKDCREGKLPKSNSSFWKEKLEKNVIRDEKNIQLLKNMGWRVFVIWECDIEKRFDASISHLCTELQNK